MTGREGLGSTHTLQQNGDHMLMPQERTHKEMNVIKVKPFTNNPSLPQTQRYEGTIFLRKDASQLDEF